MYSTVKNLVFSLYAFIALLTVGALNECAGSVMGIEKDREKDANVGNNNYSEDLCFEFSYREHYECSSCSGYLKFVKLVSFGGSNKTVNVKFSLSDFDKHRIFNQITFMGLFSYSDAIGNGKDAVLKITLNGKTKLICWNSFSSRPEGDYKLQQLYELQVLLDIIIRSSHEYQEAYYHHYSISQ